MRGASAAFTKIDFAGLNPNVESGETGQSLSRLFETAGVRVRLVDYRPGYLADHWCDRGHVFYLQSGEVDVELKDGRVFTLSKGQAFLVSDYGDSPHRVNSKKGGVALIVD